MLLLLLFLLLSYYNAIDLYVTPPQLRSPDLRSQRTKKTGGLVGLGNPLMVAGSLNGGFIRRLIQGGIIQAGPPQIENSLQRSQ